MGITKRIRWKEAAKRKKAEKEKRKSKAIQMYVSGYKENQIANQLKVTPSTVKKYLREWRKER